jgi:hypothetical protein
MQYTCISNCILRLPPQRVTPERGYGGSQERKSGVLHVSNMYWQLLYCLPEGLVLQSWAVDPGKSEVHWLCSFELY